MLYPKYVTVNYREKGMIHDQETMFIFPIWVFPIWVTHKEMIKRLRINQENIIGAGFVDISRMTCFGKLESLKIGGSEIDGILLKNLFEK